MSESFTIFGADGYVGRHLAAHLSRLGHRVRSVTRNSWPAKGRDLGNAIFTIGMTADFRGKPIETVETQVVRLHAALSRYRFASFLYLSSTRVYRDAASTDETAALAVSPADPDDSYNVTKLAAESLCLSLPRPTVRVVRLSNVYGGKGASPSFLQSVLEEAARTGHVRFLAAPDSAKDYVHIDDVRDRLVQVALHGCGRLYNLAAGQNTTHAQLACLLTAEGVTTEFVPDAPASAFPVIVTSRADREFGALNTSFADQFSTVLRSTLGA